MIVQYNISYVARVENWCFLDTQHLIASPLRFVTCRWRDYRVVECVCLCRCGARCDVRSSEWRSELWRAVAWHLKNMPECFWCVRYVHSLPSQARSFLACYKKKTRDDPVSFGGVVVAVRIYLRFLVRRRPRKVARLSARFWEAIWWRQ